MKFYRTIRGIGLIAAAVFFFGMVPALADKLCLQSTVNRRTFAVTNRRVIAPTCPKGFVELVDTESFRGPAGPAGPAGATGLNGAIGPRGPAGLLNLDACRTEYRKCSHSAGANTCTVNCRVGEFVLQNFYFGVPGPGDCIVYQSYSGYHTSIYSNGLGYNVTVTSAASCDYYVEIYALCCPIS